jgi:hypothetical protein
MKKILLTLLWLFLFIISENEIKAQETKRIYDTIIFHGQGRKPLYNVTGAPIKTIELDGFSDPVATNKLLDLGAHGLPQFDISAGSIFTSLTGIGSSGSKDVYFKYPGRITTNESSYDWRTIVYCEGSITKERERVKNSDGSHSVQTTEQRYYYWDRGAKGIIIEKGDTISRYQIISYPHSDSIADEYIRLATLRENENGYSLLNPVWKYVLYGEFRGKECAILYNSAEKIIYELEDNEISWILLTNDYSTRYKKKDRIEIKLLLQENSDENQKNDMLRMAMFGQILLFITP